MEPGSQYLHDLHIYDLVCRVGVLLLEPLGCYLSSGPYECEWLSKGSSGGYGCFRPHYNTSRIIELVAKISCSTSGRVNQQQKQFHLYADPHDQACFLNWWPNILCHERAGNTKKNATFLHHRWSRHKFLVKMYFVNLDESKSYDEYYVPIYCALLARAARDTVTASAQRGCT